MRYTSSYMEKVVNTLIDEYEKVQFAHKQRQIRKHSAKIKVSTYDWLNEISYSNFEERTAWLD